jgi:ABC-type nitrate/sulfonate/bicarbonate transport system substrate-binding protein
MVPALTAGQTDLITASLATLIGMRQGGADIRIVSGYTQVQNYFIYVRNGVNVPVNGTFEEKMKALNGMRIGAQGGADGNVVAYLKAVMTAGGGDPSTLQFANLAFGGPQVAALQSDQIDAVLADDSTVVTADQLGLGASAYSLLNDPPAQFQGMLGSGVGVMGSSLAQHPDFGERLFRAMTKTYAWMKDSANQQEMVEIATGMQGLPQTADLGSRL